MGVGTSLSVPEQAVVWEAWGEGESLRRIADRAGLQEQQVRRYLLRHGGVRPSLPRRSLRHLSPGEREEISRGIASGLSGRAIAAGLGRPSSTVSREIARNGGRAAYRATGAEARALAEVKRPRVPRLASDERLRTVVLSRLELDWSPQQIAAWLRREHPAEPGMWVSHETIYRAVYLPRSRSIPKATYQRLRTGRSMRRPRMVQRSHGRGHLRDMVSIHHRPATVADRLEPGHWEGDLVMGKRPSAVATLVERSTRYLKIVPLPDGIKAKDVSIAVARALFNVPWPTTPSSARSSTHPSTSATPAARGSAAPTRTPTASCASTSHDAPTSPPPTTSSSSGSRGCSTSAHGECLSGRRQQTGSWQPPQSSGQRGRFARW